MTLKNIEAWPKSVSELFYNVKYTVDTYQREYNWTKKQISELLEDLEIKFLGSYKEGDDRTQVEKYPHYFLGSIIISPQGGKVLIVDGQQRLISLTLLLIFLNNLQKEQNREDKVNIQHLIFSEKFSRQSFNLNIPGFAKCLNDLYHKREYISKDEDEWILNVLERYKDIEELFSEKLKGHALPYFIDWLIENVNLVEIVTHSEEEAFIIFETMNDRGLNLSPIDRLKSFLLSRITNSENERMEANALWKKRLFELRSIEKGYNETSFFLAWFSAKYVIWPANSDSNYSDYYTIIYHQISTNIHKWVRDNLTKMHLVSNINFRDFIMEQMNFFARQYIRILQFSGNLTPGFEDVFYCDRNPPISTIIYSAFLAPLMIEDSDEIIDRKIKLVAAYLETLVTFSRSIELAYNESARKILRDKSPVRLLVAQLINDIRNADVKTLALKLRSLLPEINFDLFNLEKLSYINHGNEIHYILARITSHIERQSKIESDFRTYYLSNEKPFEIEHIIANKFQRHQSEFSDPDEFNKYRNSIGNLVLLQSGFNQSLNDAPYEEKVKAYFGQNLLAKSLNEQCYKNNPSFKAYIKRSKLPFKPYPTHFGKDEISERAELYRLICSEIWNSKIFDKEIEK